MHDMNDSYTELTPEIIKALKNRGYHSVQISPVDDKDSNHSLIELIPVLNTEFQLDLIPLDSGEIFNYIGQNSPMVRYIVNRAFLPETYSA